MSYELSKHQAAIVSAPWRFTDVNNFFLVGGYGSGKSFALVMLILTIASKYYNVKDKIKVGVYAPTIDLLRATIISDLQKVCLENNILFELNKIEKKAQVLNSIFYFGQMDNPNDIYAHNYNITIVDEIDELKHSKVAPAFQAIKERTRVELPDRSPFTVFASTAQGKRGLFDLLEDLKAKKIKYYKVKGRTQDNPFNAGEYYSFLFSLYDDKERAAFLEGEFVDLSRDRVYVGFDQSRNVGKYDLEMLRTDGAIYIGQDLNVGFSRAAACVVTDDKIVFVNDFEFEAIGDAPEKFRNTYGNADIFWYPDASGNELINSYSQEMRRHNINVRFSTVNPRILERVFILNKMLAQGQIVIDENCKRLIKALKTRQYAQTGMPEKEGGRDANEHICDACEYVVWRLVQSLPQFANLRRVKNA